jgi:hypothetical protein
MSVFKPHDRKFERIFSLISFLQIKDIFNSLCSRLLLDVRRQTEDDENSVSLKSSFKIFHKCQITNKPFRQKIFSVGI